MRRRQQKKKSGCKLFISHSTIDKEAATLLVNFLVNGLGINEELIFCSSVSGHEIPVGQNFNDYILKKIRQSSRFFTIAIISNVYYNSKYCLYELGAAWGLSKSTSIIPFLIDGMNRGNLKDFIQHTQAVIGDDDEDINKLSDQLLEDKNLKTKSVPTNKFETERAKLITGIKLYNYQRKKQNNFPSSPFSRGQKIKLVVFDFDGTILQGQNYKHSWIEIWKHLNYDPSIRKDLQNKHKINHREYTFKDWCNDCVDYFKKRNFKRGDVNEIIKNRKLKLATNFVEVVSVLNALGIRIIIISGGIDTFINEVIDDSTLELIDEVFVNKFIYNKQGPLESVIPYQENESDGAGKIRILNNYCKKKNIDLKEVVFVGDEVNDIDIMQIVEKPIVYPASEASRYLKEKSLNFELIHQDSLVYLLPKILS